MVVYAIEVVKEGLEEGFVTKEELEDVALGQMLETTKDPLVNEVCKFIEEKKNSVPSSVNGGLSTVQ